MLTMGQKVSLISSCIFLLRWSILDAVQSLIVTPPKVNHSSIKKSTCLLRTTIQLSNRNVVHHLTSSSKSIEEMYILDDLKPKTMMLSQSMLFFTKYLSKHLYEQRLKKGLSNKNKKRMLTMARSRSTSGAVDSKLLQILESEIEKENSESGSFSETISKLNQSRKDLIKLVGYDSALLIPCFGFATLAALMNSTKRCCFPQLLRPP